MTAQILMMVLAPAILFLGVAGSGIFLPPSKDETGNIRLVIENIWWVLGLNGLLFGLATYFYLSEGASALFWLVVCAALPITIVQLIASAMVMRRRAL